MSLNPKPCMDDYFSQDWRSKQDFFPAVFTRRRFRQIYRSFHVAPPLPPRERTLQTRGHKVKNIVEFVDKKCREMFSAGEYVSIGESTIASREGLSSKCTLLKNRSRGGFVFTPRPMLKLPTFLRSYRILGSQPPTA